MKKRKDGRYQKKVTLADGRQKMVYGRTIAEVNQAADQLRDQERSGLIVGDTTTVGEWAKTWITTYKAGLRGNTLSMYRTAYNVHILPFLANMQLKDVRPVHIQKVMQSVAAMSDSAQHKVLMTMRQLFTTARHNGLVMSDPTEGIKTTPHSKPKKKTHLTLEEQEQLMARLTHPRARVFVGLCLYYGLRREEALGLQWGDIDGNKLTVNRARTFVGSKTDPSQELKNKTSHRTVPIPRPLQEILAATPRIGLHVVTCADGRPMTSSGFQSLWDIVRQKSPCEIRAHMLRHSYCSNLYRAGIDLKTAQYLMGHSTIDMTANVYTHLAKEDTAASVIQLEKYLATGNQGTGDFSGSSQKVVIG